MSFVYVLQDSEVLHLFFVYVLQDSKGLLFMCCRTVRCCIFFVHMLQDGEVLYHLFTCCRTEKLVCVAVSVACVLQDVTAAHTGSLTCMCVAEH